MKLPLFISAVLLILLTSCYGAQQTINLGTTPSDGTGDSLRTAFGKVNTNFTELYSLNAAINAGNITSGTLPIARIADGSVTNAKLLNSSITINGTAVNLGESISVNASTNLTGLTDVTITSAATNDFLVKSAGDWVNLTPSNARTALGLSSAGGVLSGSFPNPGFAVDMAEQSELNNALLSLSASNLTSGTLPIARIANGSITLDKITGLGTLATQSATITDYLTAATAASTYAPLSNPTFTSRVNIFGGGVSSGLLHLYDADSSNWVRFITSSSLASNTAITVPGVNGTMVTTGDTDSVTTTMILNGTILAADIADATITNAKLTNSAITINGTPVSLGGSISISSGATLGANTFTGLQQFSGTTHAGLRLNNLTTSQRDALTGSAGDLVWNTTTGRLNAHNGTSWTPGFVRLDGDSMTGPLSVAATNSTAVTINGTASGGSANRALVSISDNWTGTTGGTSAPRVFDLDITDTGGAPNYASTLLVRARRNASNIFTIDHGGSFNWASGGCIIDTNNSKVQVASNWFFSIAGDASLFRSAAGVLAVRSTSSTAGAALELLEQTAPAAPAADRVRIYAEDNGSGKTRLVVRWADGTTSVLITQP